MKIGKSEKQLLYLFFLVLVILQIYFLFKNEKVYEGTDNVTHFQIARYAFNHPLLFLDSWGKPVFTTLISPFTLLGFKAAQLFNLAVALFTLLFVFKISKQIFSSGAFFTVVLTAFAPVYFLLMITSLTEVLFSLVLVISVYFFIKNKFLLSALVLSFIPFVRTEGIVLFPVFAIAFVLKRSYLSVLFLSAGALFFSFIGLLVFTDFFWIINRFPYPTGKSVYGSGELFHFVKNSNFIFGVPLIILIISGLFFWLKEILQKFKLNSESLILFIIIAGSWITYFAAHSFVWWKGMGGSLGLIRVIGGVIPLAALTASKTFQPLYEKLKNQKIAAIILSVFAVAQVLMFFNQSKLPFKNGPVEKLIATSAEYLRENFPDDKVYYFNPEFSFRLGLDPYDQTKCNWGIGDKIIPSNSMEFGSVLIWDAHFGPNEGGVSLEAVENDKLLQPVKTFLPLEKITVLGGYDYSIHIFKKVKSATQGTNSNVFKRNLELNPGSSSQVIDLLGEDILEIPKGNEYSPNIVIYKEELPEKELFECELEIAYKSDEIINEKEVLLVFSVENGKESLKYETIPLIWNKDDSGWKSAKLSTRFSADIPENSLIKMYIWNRNHKHIFVKSLNAKITGY